MPETGARNRSYVTLFAAAGLFADEKNLEDACILEYEDGVIVQGIVPILGERGWKQVPRTFILNLRDLEPYLKRVVPRLA